MTQYICTACRVRFNSHQPLSFARCGRCGRTSYVQKATASEAISSDSAFINGEVFQADPVSFTPPQPSYDPAPPFRSGGGGDFGGGGASSSWSSSSSDSCSSSSDSGSSSCD